MPSRLQKTFLYFELIPKHQEQKEIFAADTEENRTVSMKPHFKSVLLFCVIEMDQNTP